MNHKTRQLIEQAKRNINAVTSSPSSSDPFYALGVQEELVRLVVDECILTIMFEDPRIVPQLIRKHFGMP